jgi:tRNA (Thr-GGU) A37 N-methylase
MDEADPPEAVCYRPVGIVRSPFTTLEGMPLQSVAAGAVRGPVVVVAEFAPGLKDLDGFSHLHLVTHLHRGSPGGLGCRAPPGVSTMSRATGAFDAS